MQENDGQLTAEQRDSLYRTADLTLLGMALFMIVGAIGIALFPAGGGSPEFCAAAAVWFLILAFGIRWLHKNTTV